MMCKHLSGICCANSCMDVSSCPLGDDMYTASKVCKGYEELKINGISGVYNPDTAKAGHVYVVMEDHTESGGVHLHLVDHTGKDINAGHLLSIKRNGNISRNSHINNKIGLQLNEYRELTILD